MAAIPEMVVPVISFEGRMQALDLQPGDVFVVHSDEKLSPSAHDCIRQAFKVHYPDHKVLILDKGLTLNIMRNADEPKPDVIAEKRGREFI